MKKRIGYSLIFIAIVILLDQLTKHLARIYISPFETISIFPFLNLVNVHNTGAAFGMFRSFGNIFFISVSAAAIIFIFWVIVTGKEDYRLFSLLAGGAIGNLIDRILFGHVVDFVDVYVSGFYWPAFNIADSALTAGIFFLAIKLIKKRD